MALSFDQWRRDAETKPKNPSRSRRLGGSAVIHANEKRSLDVPSRRGVVAVKTRKMSMSQQRRKVFWGFPSDWRLFISGAGTPRQNLKILRDPGDSAARR
jgi:hypothetical protein